MSQPIGRTDCARSTALPTSSPRRHDGRSLSGPTGFRHCDAIAFSFSQFRLRPAFLIELAESELAVKLAEVEHPQQPLVARNSSWVRCPRLEGSSHSSSPRTGSSSPWGVGHSTRRLAAGCILVHGAALLGLNIVVSGLSGRARVAPLPRRPPGGTPFHHDASQSSSAVRFRHLSCAPSAAPQSSTSLLLAVLSTALAITVQDGVGVGSSSHVS